MTKKAIGYSEFIELPEELQLDLLHVDGVYIGKRKVNGQVVILHQLYGFYVEVYYKKYRKKIDRIVTSDHTDILQPYMDQIHVKGLNKNKGDE
jgi:hypothetical protein